MIVTYNIRSKEILCGTSSPWFPIEKTYVFLIKYGPISLWCCKFAKQRLTLYFWRVIDTSGEKRSQTCCRSLWPNMNIFSINLVLQYFYFLAFQWQRTRYSVDYHGHKLRQLTYGIGNIYRRIKKFEYCLSQPNFLLHQRYYCAIYWYYFQVDMAFHCRLCSNSAWDIDKLCCHAHFTSDIIIYRESWNV